MPEIVGSLVTDGVVITLPEPTAYDAWAQFFKNATQMGLFVMVILFSGVLSSELSKGTLINLLTKDCPEQRSFFQNTPAWFRYGR